MDSKENCMANGVLEILRRNGNNSIIRAENVLSYKTLKSAFIP